jgi:hypothetical protein
MWPPFSFGWLSQASDSACLLGAETRDQHVGEANDRVERRAQLVADAGAALSRVHSASTHLLVLITQVLISPRSRPASSNNPQTVEIEPLTDERFESHTLSHAPQCSRCWLSC